jgi:cbb3-type cytochrome oxidase subunit 3
MDAPQQLPLKDIHIPEAISWWPPAIGWWLLALLVILLVAGGIWLYKRLTRKTAIKTAKNLLLAIKQNTEINNQQKLIELSMLVRRTAISNLPRADVAGLTGQDWLLFLDNSVKDAAFTNGIGQLLGDAPYRKISPSDDQISQLISLCQDWLNAQATPKK